MSAAVTVTVCHVFQLPVPGKARLAATTLPLTLTSIGRLVVVPLAYRMTSDPVPAAGAVTVHWMNPPVALVKSTNPVPEKPVWSVATTALDRVAFSAS